MSSSQTFRSRTPRSREKKALNPNPSKVSGNEALSTQTPQKSEALTRRARNANFVLSIGDIRRAAAKTVGELTQKRRTDQIDPWGEETLKKTCVSFPEKLPEMRFTYGHLAQLKFVMPEVIEIKKVLIKDERTSCLKPDLHVTINADALESNGKSKSEGGANTDKLPLSSSQGDEISDTVQLPLFSSQASFLLLYMELSYPRTYILSTPCFVACIRCLFVAPCMLVMWPSFDVILADQVSVVIPLLELKKATKSMRDVSNISSYLFHWNQFFPWPQSGVVSTVKALCFEVQLPKPSQELFQ
ncbi:hypothetical protein ACFX2I_035563 [Malus domestica]